MKTKSLLLFISALLLSFAITSCNPKSDNPFVGVWGVEKIEYYNIDYNGDPIDETIETFNFEVGGDNGIDLCFKGDKTGFMDDRELDTIKYFTYTYDKDASILYMKMKDAATTYGMYIESVSKTEFVYLNEYIDNTVEKAYLKWISSKSNSSSKGSPAERPSKPGSLLNDK